MQGNGELISVIVPVYNIEEYLKRCVDSITAQTYAELDIILVDDGSTDTSLHICEELAKSDERIRVLHKENGGSSSARNMGIAHALGEYIGFVDSDDYVEASMYRNLYDAVCKHRVLMAQCGRDDIDEHGSLLPRVCIPPEEETVIGAEDFLKELLMHKGDCSFCTKLIHKSLFDQGNFPEGQLNEDFHLLIQMLPHIGRGIASIPQTGYHVFYRMGSNTRTLGSNSFSRVYIDIVHNADMIEELVKQSFPKLISRAKRFALFQRLEYMLHVPIGDMNGQNPFYRQVVRYLRKNMISMLTSKWLTGRNKGYLLVLSTAPKMIRRLHLGWMRVRGIW